MPTSARACELARYAAKVGIDWVSSVAPVYFGQNFDAAYDHYKTISEATDLPFMIYSVMGKLVPDQALRFFELKNVHGMKYTGRDFSTHKSVMKYLGIDCGNSRRPAGRPLTQAEYDAYIAEIEALGIFCENDAKLI